MFGVSARIFWTVVSSTSCDGSFFSVAITTPSVATIPSDVAPADTAFSAYSICTSLPLGLNVVSENEYCVGAEREVEWDRPWCAKGAEQLTNPCGVRREAAGAHGRHGP